MIKEEQVKLMEDLLQKKEGQIPQVSEGDLIKGKVLEINNNTLYLDLGLLGGGIIMGRELHDGLGTMNDLKAGDEIEATVIDVDRDDGYVELSLREAGYDKAWDELDRKMKEKDIVEVKILEANKGGLIIKINGVVGFLPVSQLTTEHYPRVENGDKNRILSILESYSDETFKVRIIAAEKDGEKLIVSEKAAKEEEIQAQISELKIGDKVEGEISGVVDFGAFVKFNDDMEGLVHISELAWQRIDNPRDIVKVGQKIKCQIIGIDRDRISLSMKALKEDPWAKKAEKYKVEEVLEGEVTKINPFGAFVQLDDDIHGLAHVSELPKGTPLDDLFKVGEKYKFVVLSIEPKDHRLGLCLESIYLKKKEEDKKKKDSPTEKKKTEEEE